MSGKNAIVIGAGIGGLAAAVRLSAAGYNVTVFDKNEQPGGKLTEFQLGAYRFDFGPSLFTMPEYVDELFTLAGKNPKDYFEYFSLDESCRYFYPDGQQFFAPTDGEIFAQKASEAFNEPKNNILKYFKYNRNIFGNAGRIFLTKSMHKLKTFLSLDALKSVGQSYVIEMFRSMNAANEKAFTSPKLIQLFNRYATYNGSSPYKAPAMLNSISVLEHLYGTYFPVGGMSNISNAIYRLGKELGVKYHFNEEVLDIHYSQNQVTGVKTTKRNIEAKLVMSNMDVSFTYDKLLPEVKKPALYTEREKSSSAIIFYWGVKKDFSQLGLHNIFFAENYPAEFHDLFENKNIHLADPTIYINITSKHHPTDAPEGGSNWFVMINAPADFGQDWAAMQTRLRQNIIEKLSKHLNENIEELIEEERIVDPTEIESFTLSHKGALYGTSSNNWLNAFFRHPNFSSKLEGLYFVGGSVHPGGGIPLCLLSAKITTALVDGKN